MFLEPGDLLGRGTPEIEILQVALRKLLPVNGLKGIEADLASFWIRVGIVKLR